VKRTILSARDITKKYEMGKSSLEVLKGVDLDVIEGEILAVIGESGAGKSTLLHILGMLDRPTSGMLVLNGENLIGRSEEELATYKNRFVGFIFQFHHLLPEFTAVENVIMPALIGGTGDRAGIQDRAETLLRKVGLSERMHHRPSELSGGELQRVSVARALMNQPSMIFADEPSGNLDHRNSEMLHDLIWDLAREHNLSFVVVTHDLGLAARADKVVLLEDGMLREVEKENLSERFLP